MYDLPHHAGHHSYITRAAILFIIGLLVGFTKMFLVKVKLCPGATHLLAESHWEGGITTLGHTQLQRQSQ